MAVRVDTDFQAVYIHEPLGHNVPALNTAWTVAGLYRLEADVNLDTLIVALYGTTAAGSWVGLYMNADGITCRLEGWNGTGSPVVSSNYTLEVGRDYRLAIDYNGSGTVRMLLDGVAVLTLSFTPVAGTAGQRSLQWGGYGEISGYTDCTIARWRMWTAVLSEAEHRAEYRSLTPVRTSGLIHNWPMNAGATRFDDTVAGQPDLVDNPAVPCGDGTPFVYRPSIIGTPQFFDLGETTTPGAQTVTVPEFAEKVAIFFYETDDAGTPDSTLSTLVSDFAGTFTIEKKTAVAVAQAVAVAAADVVAFGAGRTFTPTFTAVNILAGAGCWVVFLQDAAGLALAVEQAGGAGTTAGTASAPGLENGLSIAVDTRLDPAAGNYPANPAGWTSIGTDQTTGTYAYWACSRIRERPITADGTESATTQNTNGSCISLLTVGPRALASVVPDDLAHGHALDAVTLTTSSATSLVPADLAQAHALDAVTLILDTHLAPADLAYMHTLDAVALSTLQPLSVADLSQGQTLDAVVLTTTSGATLEPADMLQGHALEAVALTTLQPLAVAGLLHLHTLDAVALSSLTGLTVADLAHAHALGSPAVNTALSLALADLLHAHSLDAVALSSATSLAPAALTHGHALDAVALSSLVVLALADLLHAHALDNVALSTDDSTSLALADLLHSHTLESPTLVTEVGLTVARLVHTQSLEGVTLGAMASLVVADMLHAHALDAVVLDNVPALQVARLTHAHTLDSVTLSALATLVVSDMLHAHRLEGVTLSGDDVETERALIVRGRPRVWGIEGSPRNWRIE